MHRLEQVSIRTIHQLQIDAEGGVKVSKNLSGNRNTVVTLGFQGLKLLGGHGVLHTDRYRQTRDFRTKGAIAFLS
jgi:hypothetical protein